MGIERMALFDTYTTYEMLLYVIRSIKPWYTAFQRGFDNKKGPQPSPYPELWSDYTSLQIRLRQGTI